MKWSLETLNSSIHGDLLQAGAYFAGEDSDDVFSSRLSRFAFMPVVMVMVPLFTCESVTVPWPLTKNFSHVPARE